MECADRQAQVCAVASVRRKGFGSVLMCRVRSEPANLKLCCGAVRPAREM